jgi:hypothetical protein
MKSVGGKLRCIGGKSFDCDYSMRHVTRTKLNTRFMFGPTLLLLITGW